MAAATEFFIKSSRSREALVCTQCFCAWASVEGENGWPVQKGSDDVTKQKKESVVSGRVSGGEMGGLGILFFHLGFFC